MKETKKERKLIEKVTWEKQNQTARERETEETGVNVLKADSKKSLKVTDKERGDLGNV
jgi:hypothetical protein